MEEAVGVVLLHFSRWLDVWLQSYSQFTAGWLWENMGEMLELVCKWFGWHDMHQSWHELWHFCCWFGCMETRGSLFLYSWLLYWVDVWEFIAVFFCTGVDRVWMLSIAATVCSLARLICFMGCIGQEGLDLDRMQVSWQVFYYLVWIDRLQRSNNEYNEW